jgi:hypothetical protein
MLAKNQLDRIHHSQLEFGIDKILAILKETSPENYRYQSRVKTDIFNLVNLWTV